MPEKEIILVYSARNKFDTTRGLPNLGKGHMPLGILYCATYLHDKGYAVVCIDERFEDPLEYITQNSHKISCVGFSVFTADYHAALKSLAKIRELNENICCIIGGPHASAVPEEAISDGFDVAVIGEGEIILFEIIEKVDSFRTKDWVDNLYSVQSISFRDKNDKIVLTPRTTLVDDLDVLSAPRREFLSKYPYPVNEASITTSRGCPGNCIYCQSGPSLFGKHVRQRKPESVIAELKNLINNGVKMVTFLDDCLLSNEQWVHEFCNCVANEDLHFIWICETRMQFVKETTIKKIIESGCRGLNIGVESGSDSTLKFLKKGQSVKVISKGAEILDRYGLAFHAYIIIGCPNETIADLQETVDIVKRITPGQICVSRLTPIKGSKLYQYVLENGMMTSDKSEVFYENRYPIRLTNLSEGDLNDCEIEIYKAMFIDGEPPEKPMCRAFLFDDKMPPKLISKQKYSMTIRVKNASNFHWIAYPGTTKCNKDDLSKKEVRDNFVQQINGKRVELFIEWYDKKGRALFTQSLGHLVGNVRTKHSGTFVCSFSVPDKPSIGYYSYLPIIVDEQKRFDDFGFSKILTKVQIVRPEISTTQRSKWLKWFN